KGINTNVKTIFFSGANIPQKYIRKRGNLYKIRTHTGDTADPQDFGYFKKRDDEYIFIPPKTEGNLYNKVNKEVKRRLQGESKNSDFDHLFEEGSLKDKYRWILGETGKNNQFVEDK
ncbi:MAG: hypothetical protein K9L56_14750, partial [Clostridiales bacterium]|nr:hypothetical protein [Clostridiales bacterium]